MERNCQNNEMEKQPLLAGDREAGEEQEVREDQDVSVQQPDRGDPPDGGQGWIVVIACFFALFTLDGIGYSFGMFMEPLKSEMGESNAEVASVGSLQIAVYLTTGPLVSKLIDLYGARLVSVTGSLVSALGLLTASYTQSFTQLLVTYSLVTGIGFGLMYIPGVTGAQGHFTRRRALATGIAVCGTGVGTLVLPPLVEHCISQLGWRGAMRALSGLCLASVACGAAMFPAPEVREEQEEASSEEAGERKEVKGVRWLLSFVVGENLASSPNLLLFLTCMAGDFLATMSLYIPYTHLPDMAIARGVAPPKAAFLISSAGIASTAGRFLAGLACGQLHPLTITLLATAAAAIQSFLLSMCTEYWTFVVLTSGFGLATGFWVACETPLINRTVSFSCLIPAFGFLTFGGGLAALTGAPLAGRVMDLAGSTASGLGVLVCGAIMTGSASVYAIATCYRLARLRAERRRGYEEI